MTSNIRVVISGRVHGVGYRMWLQGEAVTRGISGWVRNRSNGDVEALLCGPEDVVEELLAALWTGPPAASVTSVEQEDADAAPPEGYQVRPTD